VGRKKKIKKNAVSLQDNPSVDVNIQIVETVRPMKCDVCKELSSKFRYEYLPSVLKWKLTCVPCLEKIGYKVDTNG